jgi:hypothetical protein
MKMLILATALMGLTAIIGFGRCFLHDLRQHDYLHRYRWRRQRLLHDLRQHHYLLLTRTRGRGKPPRVRPR